MKSGLYVAPFKKEVSALEKLKRDKNLNLDDANANDKKKKDDFGTGQLWNSDMEEDSSSEDFEYLQQHLEEYKTLP